jgi:hypothetical protein
MLAGMQAMTGRERLSSILRKRGADRLCWTTLVDQRSIDEFPEPWRSLSDLDVYRGLGCDILLLNSGRTAATQVAFESPRMVWPDGTRAEERRATENGAAVHRLTLHTPRGTLTRVSMNSHPVKGIVETLEELRIYREAWEGVSWVPADETAKLRTVDGMLGADGITTRFSFPTAIPHLLETDIGIERFYYLNHDHPEDMKGLIDTMHDRMKEAFAILAQDPFDVQIIVENTSTRYISPKLYRSHNGPHQRDFVDAMHAAGKVAILHMCGHVRGLLRDIRETGADGIHALTPPPVGDTPWEDALDVLGEDTVLIGALSPSVFVSGPVDEIGPALDAAYTPRLRRANFILCPFTDGLTVPLERFQAVARWMERNG